jgi:Transposase DDE domain
MIYHLYEARLEDCQSCARRPECCPDNKKHGRSAAQFQESPVMIAFRKKMASEEARKQCRRRGRIVEFCHAWIKSKLGLRQFHVRGLKKVQMEKLWACLTYNLQHWIRLSKLRTTTMVT